MKGLNMKAQEITVDVNARLSIPQETVERCLLLIEMYLNDNQDVRISGGVRDADGKVEPFKIERAGDLL